MGLGDPAQATTTKPAAGVNIPSTAGVDASKINKVGGAAPAYQMAMGKNRYPDAPAATATATPGTSMTGLPSWLTQLFQPSGNYTRPANMTATSTTAAAPVGPEVGASNVPNSTPPAPGIVPIQPGMSFSGVPLPLGNAYKPFNPTAGAAPAATPGKTYAPPIQLLDPNYKGPATADGKDPNLNQWGYPKPKDFDYIDNLKIGDQKYSEIPTANLMQFANAGNPAMNEYIAWRMGPLAGATPGVVSQSPSGSA